MNNTLFLYILLILVISKISGELITRIGYPSVVAEIATGIILGPSVLAVIQPNASLQIFSELGFILVLVYAGLHLDVSKLLEVSRQGLVVTLVGVPLTIASGYAVGRFFGYPDLTSISIGSAMAISSVGMSARVLVDLDQLQTPAGITLISVAVIDDIAGVAFLGALLSLSTNNGASSLSILTLILRVGLFFLFIYILGFILKTPEKMIKPVNKSKTMGTLLSYVFVVLFASMSLAELLGIHAIIGAFFAGLMLNRGFAGAETGIRESIMIFTFGLFAPLAYSWVGLNTTLGVLVANIPLLVVILFTGFASRIVGGVIGGKLVGLEWGDSLIVGVGLTGRAGIELAILEVLRSANLINSEIYTSFVILTATACIIMPFMLKCVGAWLGGNK